jgi:hypothetical protein
MSKTLKNWRARRSGNAMTIYGELGQSSSPTKITEVIAIRPGAGRVLATDRAGIDHVLLI